MRLIRLVLIAVMFAGCGESGGTPGTPGMPSAPDAGPSPVESDIPLLAPGSHLGMMIGFEVYPLATAAEADAKWGEAVAAGMKIGRVHLDWSSLETAPGRYDLTPLRDALTALTDDGLAPLVSIYTVDSEGYVVPPDLMSADTEEFLVDGKRLDDADVLARYRALLDQALPIIAEHGGWGILLANEPEAVFDADPSAVSALRNLVVDARDHIHKSYPDLAVSATLTMSDPFGERDLSELITEFDFATFNYYPLAASLDALEPTVEKVRSDFDAIVAAARGREVVIQELGCPSGYGPDTTVMGASEAMQRDFFRRAFAEIESRDQVRAAFVFQLVDWSPGLAAELGESLRAEGFPEFADRFEEWLRTSGLITYDLGAEKPAWAEFIAAL